MFIQAICVDDGRLCLNFILCSAKNARKRRVKKRNQGIGHIAVAECLDEKEKEASQVTLDTQAGKRDAPYKDGGFEQRFLLRALATRK